MEGRAGRTRMDSEVGVMEHRQNHRFGETLCRLLTLLSARVDKPSLWRTGE